MQKFILTGFFLFGVMSMNLNAANSLKIDINKADQQQLQKLKGIGKIKAAAIINYRKSHGNFKNIDDLKKVAGINQKIIKDNKEQFSV